MRRLVKFAVKRSSYRCDPAVRRLVMVCAVVVLTMASAASGYIVVFKDGTRINTEEKYRIEGDRAILVLIGGQETSFPAAEIDVEECERINTIDYGNAVLIEGKETRQLGKKTTFEPGEETFSELLARRDRGLVLPEVRRRSAAVQDDGAELELTKAGFVDLMKVGRKPYQDSEINSELQRFLKGRGVEDVRLFQGTTAQNLLLEIVTGSEAMVFKALKDSANGLVLIHERFPDRVAAFELLLLTTRQVRAGQFLMTPELANVLVTESLDAPSFFLRYVEF